MFLFLFLVSHYATLAIDLYYEVIHDIYLLFMFCEIKNFFFFFTCIFHTCIYMFVKCYKNIHVDSVVLLFTLATNR